MNKKGISFALAAAMAFSLVGCADDAVKQGKDKNMATEYSSIIDVNRLPLKAVYTEPATNWEQEALPMGNGFLGAMVFGGVEADRIQVNEHSIWSGGPGASEDYDGGMSDATREENVKNLMAVREQLQEFANEFSANRKAYIKDGKVVTGEYPWSDAAENLINTLKGEKDYFGTYQSLGDIYIGNPEASKYAKLVSTTITGCKNTDPQYLIDGNDSTKWFSADGGTWGSDADTVYPVEIVFEYSKKHEIFGYSLTSGDDDYDRDPKHFTFSGSYDGKKWEVIDERTDVQFDERNQTLEFMIDRERIKFKYYKLTILENEGGWGTQLCGIDLLSEAEEKDYSNYQRVLDLDNAITTVKYTRDGVDYEKEYFVSNPDNFMAIRMTASKEGGINEVVSFETPQPNATITYEGDTITITGRPSNHREDIEHLEFAGQVKIVTDGTTEATESGISVKGASEMILYFTAATNYVQCMDDSFDYFSNKDPLKTVEATLKTVCKKDYEDLKQAHIDDYRSLYARLELDIGLDEVPSDPTDVLLEKYKNDELSAGEARYLESLYYQFGRYLLIGSSREGSLPANLQGIWADGLYSPWDADYHTNINVQMNYWLAQQTNLTECHTPMIEYINSLVERGKITAELYHCTEDGGEVRGWTTYHENNIWGNTGPATSGAFYFPAAAAWCCQDIWEYYRFTLDEEFLKDNFDTILGASLFWVDNLVTDERDGSLVSSPSRSPEHGPYSMGCSCDQGIIWECFDFTIKAAEILGIENSEIEEIKAAKEKLWMPEIGLNGEYLEWKDETTLDITGDYQHRHVNNLFTLHPGTNVVAGRSDEDDEKVEAMKKVLEVRGDGGTGWSKAWKINFWARLRDGNHAGTMVNQILKESTYENLFDTHPPFQIDGNFGATAGMTEMLVQSQGDSIDLLPSLPDMWANGSVKGVKARGNVEVNIAWENGKATLAELIALSGGELKVSAQGIESATLTDADGNAVSFTIDAEGKMNFTAEEGKAYIIRF